MYLCVITLIIILGFFRSARNEKYEEDSRILGGRDALPGEFPFAVALLRNGEFICTSSLICEEYILTAAHCVVGEDGKALPASSYSGILGSISRTNFEHEVKFDSITVHEDYNDNTIENDIAIMKLSEGVLTKSICIPAKGKTFVGETALAIGWGRNFFKIIPDILQVVGVDVTSDEHCSTAYKLLSLGSVEITEKQVCAGSTMKGVCNGDSGGPLFVFQEKENITIGVTSFGSYLGCGFPFVPAVYTSNSYFSDWITKNAPCGVCTS